MQVVENVALISINATLVVQLISFLIFMVLFNRMMIRPLRTIMAERERFVQKIGRDVTAAGQAFEEMTRQIERQETEARLAASKIREEIVEAGQRSVADVLAKTRQEVGVLRKAAQKETDTHIMAARENLQAEAKILADHMIASLLDRRSSN
jgi:F-type H+-transporting ATPase subunit b